MYEKMHELVDASFDEQLAQTREVVRIRSVLDESKSTEAHPFGPELTASLDDFLTRARNLGFTAVNVDNYAGYAEMGGPGKDSELVGILAHLDVVPEGNERDWQHPPYAAEVADGALWGRGSIDDKGPAMAALYAMKALRDSGVPLRKRFRLILGLDEESGSRCILHYNQVAEVPAFSFSPDAEFPVVNAEKGILRATITKRAKLEAEDGKPSLLSLTGGDRFNVVPDAAFAHIVCLPEEAETIEKGCGGLIVKRAADGLEISASGASAHAMEPWKGENAVQKLLACLAKIDFGPGDNALIRSVQSLAGTGHNGADLGIACEDEVSGPLTCNAAAVQMNRGEAGEGKISLKLDIRYPVTANADRLIGEMEKHVADAGGSLTISTHKKPLYIPADHPTVRTLMDAYETITGERPEPVSMGGGTYCRFMPNSVSAGPLFPGQPELAHQANERVALDDLRRSTHIYAEALARFNEM